MVKVEQVEDELDAYISDDDERDYVTTDDEEASSYSEEEEDDELLEDDSPESLLDRISALKDIIPAAKRSAICNKLGRAYDWASWSTQFMGKTAWVVTTSALLLIFPLALEIEKEQALMAYEAEVKMQQQGQQQVLQPFQQQQAKPTGIVPPGF